MADLPEGFRRLSVVAGVLGAVAWLAYALMAAAGGVEMQPRDWLVVAGVAVLAYLAPWAIVRGIGWAIEGFRERGRAR